MKKMITLTVAFLLTIGATFAGNGNHVQELISKKISVPPGLKHTRMNEKVNVQFSISGTGHVTSVAVSTANPELKNYVQEQIRSINFGNASGNKEMTYFIDINFRVL